MISIVLSVIYSKQKQSDYIPGTAGLSDCFFLKYFHCKRR